MEMGKITFIDGFKTFLCLMVAIGPFYNFLGGRYIYGIRVIGAMGGRAVDVFFFLTAFLTVLSYERKKTTANRFFFKRLRRLYPEYLPVLLIAIITVPLRSKCQVDTLLFYTGNNIGAFGSAATVVDFPDIKTILCHLFFINGIVPCGWILSLLWSMPMEVLFYLFFAVVIFLSAKKEKESVFLLVLYLISLIGGMALWLSEGMIDNQRSFVRWLPIFLLGGVFAEIYYDKISMKTGCLLSALGLLYDFILDVQQNWLSSGIIFTIMVFLIYDTKFIRIKTFLSASFFRGFCKMTYSIYLVHMVIIPLVFGLLLYIQSRTTVFSRASMAVTAFCLSAVLIYFYVVVIQKLIESISRYYCKKRLTT